MALARMVSIIPASGHGTSAQPGVIHPILQLYYHSETTDFHVENNGRQRLVPRDRALSAFWEVVCRK